MCMCYVSDIGKIKEIVIVAQLEPSLLLTVYIHHRWDHLNVPFAEDARRTESTRKEFAGGVV